MKHLTSSNKKNKLKKSRIPTYEYKGWELFKVGEVYCAEKTETKNYNSVSGFGKLEELIDAEEW